MTWEGLVTNYHNKYCKDIGISTVTEAYIQSIVLKKTLESVSFERRRSIEEDSPRMGSEELAQKIEATVDDTKAENQNI